MKKYLALILSLVLALSLTACGGSGVSAEEGASPAPEAAQTDAPAQPANAPKLPDNLEFIDGVPTLRVYVTETDDIRDMALEEYVMGVLAGEMRADWPMEALKAQAVLARTFVLKFLSEKTSMYDGADISTDINEAQAYDAAAVNSRIQRAVTETGGQVLSYQGEFPYAWFHAHSGGATDYPTQSLDFDRDDPPYIVSVSGEESDKAPTAVKSWKVSFSEDEIVAAANEAGADIQSLSSIALGEKSDAGRAVTLLINGQQISAPRFRLALDSSALKSTLIDSVSYENGRVAFQGRGFGHGVGMSQWGAYGMAESGYDYRDIISHFFRDVTIVNLWN